MTEEEVKKWVPLNMGYDGYKKILNSLYRKDGSQKKVSITEITSVVGFNKNWVSTTIAFVKSLKIVDGNIKDGFQFTAQGLEYTKSFLKDDEQNVKKIIIELIKNSHLKKLLDYLEINKDDLSLEKLVKHIKTEAVFPDGKGRFELAGPYLSGIYTLLKIFDSAGLIPNNVMEEISIKSPPKNTKVGSSSKKRKKPSAGELDLPVSTELEKLSFGKAILFLPKKDLKKEWEKLQKHMNLFFDE